MDASKNRLNLITSMSILFYVTKLYGVIPYGLSAYYRKKILKFSIIGNIWVILITLTSFLSSYLESSAVNSADTGGSGTLTKIIGIVIMYMEPIMLVVDAAGFVVNQNKLMECINTMQDLDDKLQKEKIKIDYRRIRKLTILLIGIITIFESGIVAYNYLLLGDTLWFAPIYVSSVSKVWYVALIFNIKQKFVMINLHFEKMQKMFNDNKRQIKTTNALAKMTTKKLDKHEEDYDQIGYLHREILVKKFKPNQKVYNTKRKVDILQVMPRENDEDFDATNKSFRNYINKELSLRGLHATVGDKLDQKLTTLCQLHFEIAETAKIVNKLFSFQMLLLMAYGFMSVTARIYFVYTGLAGQSIPIEFRSAQSPWVSVVFIAYTSAKCATVIMMSWKTKIDGQKTGVYIHKVANAIDEDHCYQTVNHLSLKLMNHWLNFTACGFFELDMSTLYAITGAVTSYIIILIQFNLAYQRTKNTTNQSTIVNATLFVNSTTPLT